MGCSSFHFILKICRSCVNFLVIWQNLLQILADPANFRQNLPRNFLIAHPNNVLSGAHNFAHFKNTAGLGSSQGRGQSGDRWEKEEDCEIICACILAVDLMKLEVGRI